MKANWNIGPVARRQLAEMAKAGWDEQNIRHVALAVNSRWFVKIWRDDTFYCGFGNTIGLAVAEVYQKWKAEKTESSKPERNAKNER